jgi:hypothetical protein
MCSINFKIKSGKNCPESCENFIKNLCHNLVLILKFKNSINDFKIPQHKLV